MAAHGDSAYQLADPIRAEVAVDYEPQFATQLKLHVGDIVYVLEKHESGWWGGHKDGDETTGWFPSTAVRCSQSKAGRRSSGLACEDEYLEDFACEERLREDLVSKDVEIKALKDQVRQLEENLEMSQSRAAMSGAEIRPVPTASRLSVSEDLAAHSYIEGRSSLGTDLTPPAVARRLFDHTQEGVAPTAIQTAPAFIAQSGSSTVVGQPPRPPPWRVNATPSHCGLALAATPRAMPTIASGRRSVDGGDSGAGSAGKRAPAVRALVSEFERRSSSLSRPIERKEPSPHRRPIASNRTASAPRTSGGYLPPTIVAAPLAATQAEAPGSRGRGGAPSAPTEMPMCVLEAEEEVPSAPVVFGMSPMLRSGASRRGLEDSCEIQYMDQKGASLSSMTGASQETMVQQRIRQLRGGS